LANVYYEAGRDNETWCRPECGWNSVWRIPG
jgi:hypothetical protein